VGHTCSPREVREEEGCCTELTKDFTGRWSDRDELLVKRSEWRRWSLVEVNGEMGRSSGEGRMGCGMLRGSSGRLL
jgi:hypothetical protein